MVGRRRVVLLMGLCALAALALLMHGLLPGRPDPVRARLAEPVMLAPVVVVLHRWDEARARAWGAGSVRDLARLYVAGSSAGARDVRLLRAYRSRGYVVRGLRRQVLGLQPMPARGGQLRVLVTDRLAGGVAVRGRSTTRLPGGEAAARLLTFAGGGGRWRLLSAVPVDAR